jgi:UDP-glucose 4-epimerase
MPIQSFLRAAASSTYSKAFDLRSSTGRSFSRAQLLIHADGRGCCTHHPAILSISRWLPGATLHTRNVRILLTGSSGRVGRAIFGALAADHEVLGIDLSPFSTTRYVADFTDPDALHAALEEVDAIIHTAGLHAPHVSLIAEDRFRRINVAGTKMLVAAAKEAGIKRFVYTSTTALYGDAVLPGDCTWIDESTTPRPRTIYHRTKLDAEDALQSEASPDFAVRVIRMSRCFPEQPEVMALYRLHRGIDVRDVADAHAAALSNGGANFQRYIASGCTPFHREDREALSRSPRDVLRHRCPELLRELERRNWPLPSSIDRVYDPAAALSALHWKTTRGYGEVFRQYDERSIEVLPRSPMIKDRTAE